MTPGPDFRFRTTFLDDTDHPMGNWRLASAAGSCQLTRMSQRLLVRFLSTLILWAILTGGSGVRAAADMPSFAEWRAACERLPSNRALGAKRPPKALLPLQSFAEFEMALNAFFHHSTNGPIASATNWVGTAPQPDPFLNVNRSWFTSPETSFEPFAEKLTLPPGDRVVLMGDLHGDIRSLMAVLGQLQARHWLDGFAVSAPEVHLAFLGDYTDRGQYGVEVLYTLMRLKDANPGHVHLVRGNHEDISLVARYGFLAEGEAKYGNTFNSSRLLRAYDFLPVALYLGSGSDFVQMCHGGMEPGFDPAALLASPGTNRFQLLGALRQARFLKAHPGWLAGDAGSASAAVREFEDFTPTAPTSPTTLGFLWNDFTVFSDEPAFSRNPDRAFVYGRPAVEGLLQEASRGGAKVHAVIRAHQHSAVPNPMMRRLMASHGVFRHWQETSSAAAMTAAPSDLAARLDVPATRTLPENSVWTLNVAPDSVYGIGCGFTFATYAVLELGNRFADWRLTVENVEIPRL